MDVSPVKLIDYYRSKRQYLVPLFQREYVWKKENWETMWNDIMSYYGDDESIANSSPHFMGAIVSIPAISIPVGVDKFLIIDGQQRLTTIAILLCVIRDVTNEENLSEEVQDLLVNKYKIKTPDYLKILPTQKDRDVFSKLITGNIQALSNDKTNHPLYLCYKYFKERFSEKIEDIGSISPQIVFNILQSLFQVVMINLANTEDPYLIFESLNFKGAKLTQTDLIRNLILMKFKHSSEEGGEQEKVYKEFWLPLEKKLGDKIEEFFFHYVRMKNVSKSNASKIYTDIKKLLQLDDINNSLRDIQKFADYYSIFLEPEKEPNIKVRKELTLIKRTKNAVVYPLLLKINEWRGNGLSDEVYAHCLQILNSFIMRRAICRWQTTVINTQIINLLNVFPSDVTCLDKWLAGELLRSIKGIRWPNNDEFRQAIVTKADLSKTIQVLFLEEIEKFLAGKEVIDFSSYITLEHIMPQNLSDEWKVSLGENFESIHTKYLWNLGNLTLTGYNSEYSNNPFEYKKNMENGYSNSGLKMNLEIAQSPKWDENEIIKRANRLADIAIQIWEYPAESYNVEKITLFDKWTYKNVCYLNIGTQKQFVSSWKDVAKIIFDYLKDQNPDKFIQLASNNSIPKFKLLSVRNIAQGDYQYELQLNLSAEDLRNTIRKWIKLFNAEESFFGFEIE